LFVESVCFTFVEFVHHISYIRYLNFDLDKFLKWKSFRFYWDNYEIEISFRYIASNNHDKTHDCILTIENSIDFWHKSNRSLAMTMMYEYMNSRRSSVRNALEFLWTIEQDIRIVQDHDLYCSYSLYNYCYYHLEMDLYHRNTFHSNHHLVQQSKIINRFQVEFMFSLPIASLSYSFSLIWLRSMTITRHKDIWLYVKIKSE